MKHIPSNLREIFQGEYHMGSKNNRFYVASGEFRAPKAGEYYLSGAVVTAYRAPNDYDLSDQFWIAVPVQTVPSIPHAFINLLIAVERGQVTGNPYADSDVKAALKALYDLRYPNPSVDRLTSSHWLDASKGLTYTGEHKECK